MLGKTSDGEFKLLCIRELDNDDVDDKPDSTDEDTQVSTLKHWPTSCGASDEIQFNVMEKSDRLLAKCCRYLLQTC